MKKTKKRLKVPFIVAFTIVLLLVLNLEGAFAGPSVGEQEEVSPPTGLTERYINEVRNKLNSLNDMLKRLVEEKEKQNADGVEFFNESEQRSSLLDRGYCYAESYLYAVDDVDGWYDYEEEWIGGIDGTGTVLVANITVGDMAFVVGEMGAWAERNDDMFLTCRSLATSPYYENYITVWTEDDLQGDWYLAGWTAPQNCSWTTFELEPDPFGTPSDGEFKYIAISVYKEFSYQESAVEVDCVCATTA
ncbi:MAG: hypothetical protein NWF06_00040 [Candidatus Bathyarchaeota archaeon]|nr:hypothetical protein [Candidatus Bathyarchaeum sp.]